MCEVKCDSPSWYENFFLLKHDFQYAQEREWERVERVFLSCEYLPYRNFTNYRNLQNDFKPKLTNRGV